MKAALVVVLLCAGCATSSEIWEAEQRCREAVARGDQERAEMEAARLEAMAQRQEALENTVETVVEAAKDVGGPLGLPAGVVEALGAIGLAYGTYRGTRAKIHRERDQKYVDVAKAASVEGKQVS